MSISGNSFRGFNYSWTQYINGLGIARASASTVTIAAGACRNKQTSSAGSYDMVVDSVLTVSTATTGVNALDTGTVANNTWYAVYVIADSKGYESIAGLLSTSLTPALPQKYNLYRRVGWVKTDASADILPFIQSGESFDRHYYFDTLIEALAAGAETIFTDVDLSSGMPSTSNLALLQLQFTPNAASDTADFRPNGSDATTVANITGQVSSVAVNAFIDMPTDADQTIEYLVSAGTAALKVDVRGFVDRV